MDFPLNSSLVLAAAVGLWLLWVAPQYLHGKQVPAPSPGRTGTAERAPSSAATEPNPSSQGNTMYNTSNGVQHTPHLRAGSAAGAALSGGVLPATAGPLKIRYGRLSLAVLGLFCVVAVVGGGAAALLGAVSGWIPAAAALGAAAVVASLRSLAVRDRRERRARRAAAAAVTNQDSRPQAPVRSNPKADTVFDAAGNDGDGPAVLPAAAEPVRPAAPQPKPIPRLTAQELRAAALAEAAKSAEAASWQPVAVPKPTYVDAPAAPRPAPEPLAVPAAPKPVLKTPIRSVAAPAAGSTAIEPRTATGILNLDDVLQRRRA
ncbi:hypothetical protein ITX31_06710 [Arthrobacter gandavensis]|uniref:hypothetical protein n=1 Tax=Arthrobacter gandavensis TaxID=169960 RepID=UPI00188EA149|nr:hypothetical protein [Arthrobacter gandavensis]MBF4993800.1 hypothetical protein [Arthrobacter gandavensis]